MDYVAIYLVGLLTYPLLFMMFRRKRTIPNVLGSSVPLKPHHIDFERRYQITAGERWGGGSIHQFEDCRIIGYVEREKGRSDGGKFGEDWIVAELPDKRKLFLTPQSIRFMEETRNDNQT